MKKVLISFFSVILVLVAFVIFLFTPPGNALLKPIVESQINSNSPVKISLEKFRVGFGTLDIKADFLNNSSAVIKGIYSLFSQNFDIDYKIHIDNLNDLKNIVNYPLRGSVNTSGNIKGDLQDIKIKGVTDFARSNSDYFIEIKNKAVLKILANIKNLDLANLLYIVNKPKFINGKLNSNIVLNSIDINNLDGNIKTYIKNAVVNRSLLKREYNLTLPKTVINLDSNVNLKGKKIDFFANLISNLAKVNVNGLFENNYLNTKYKINIGNLSVLTPVINQRIRGTFKTNGNVKGKTDNLIISGIAYLADGKISYKTALNKKIFSYNINKLKISQLLYMLYQPRYSYGVINSNGKLSFDKKINGIVNLNVSGKTDKYVLYKEFNFTNAAISYNLKSDIIIKNSVAFIKSKLNSNVANVNLPDSKYDISKNVFASSYIVNIPNLDKLYFATHKHLKGKIRVVGKIKKDKDLLVTGNSKTLGGVVDYKLFNNDFYLNAKSLYVVKLMDMLIYPQIFDSTANIDLKYNLLNKKGILNAFLLDGHFLPNKLSFLINSLAHFDLTKEIYKKTIIHSVINDKKLTTDLDMTSRLTHISSKKAFIDLEKEYVDAKILLEIMKRPIYVKLKGKLTSPNIKIDAKEFLKSEIKNRVKKEIKKQIEKNLPINNLFKF
ncbi:conserved hypothetical protein [Lebetimonas natsushimae]|uniref:AsmA-like C-terminal domain-containing protein n=1 Tax=Lebetimonas natsushimae TaxID=1936991 RepID=A0A292YH09_9BACT|nr:hypothetical protein [Lebetimonas natsushimae]GAX88296.1 conserved hypothetical protein [Lebetimonas natsushimae]